ncbi:phosphate ABC transporter permease PstA [Kiloniella laminariae]|uniref:Phosphate transport system permease protein PstA n=1 Tax=Kiloniella laminariae TaxID=454162 RepID=A0ABT4LJY5_9PROT|nr:phosphate ABC transporter permease PstA [Kiloniella laminariae]MCZ4281265.1 phosphate ABC transporter permease PstA [Kiloniella laminariae]
MTDSPVPMELNPPLEIDKALLKKRNAAETRFKLYGLAAVLTAVLVLGLLLTSIVSKGYTAFEQTYILLDVRLDQATIDPKGTGRQEDLAAASYRGILRDALKEQFPEAESRNEKRSLYGLVGSAAEYDLRNAVLENPKLVGTTATIAVKASDDVDSYIKGFIPRDVPQSDRKIKDQELGWLDTLEADDRVIKKFNIDFFTHADSREPEEAGILGAVIGSLYTLAITLALCFPIGVLTAIYLEEFAPRNRWTDIIEVNINNLAAVPSIVFGLLGLAIFLNFFGLPRSAPLVGGMVLALMTLPTIIIASRAALKAVPPSIREAALGMGASRMQTVFHHVFPLAMPGILTGTILGMAQALGETAPLLMIGMVAFIADIPGSINDAATVLPVQIFLWADSPERGFVEKTSAAIMVLLAFLVVMNAIAVLLRKRFERRW